ncbi:hypothetical protein NI454_08225 [Brevundimonas diminuta]|uniref:hypothetical protein n=1 Tax=Brevundimonas diminuta TaxID=293 RepID=UPI00209718B6|nr:hypothetical protein [Brevundimonas diminuta]MCO8029940.1 hypothetical protein [Brevundimonas diminuta]
MSAELFGLLAAQAADEGQPVEGPGRARFIKKLSADDAALMAVAQASEALIVTRQIRLVRIRHADQTYFCTFGLPSPDVIPPGLEVVDATPGLFAVAVLTARVRPIPSYPANGGQAFAIKDLLDTQYIGSAGYEGHELDDVARLFPQLTVYRASEDRAYLEIDERVLGSILVRAYIDGPIAMDAETLVTLTRVFEGDSDLIPFRNLVQGFLSISWENLFVEVYRCIEQLYALPRIEALKAELTYPSAARELAKILEDRLAWRPKEGDAFEALVRMCDEAIVSRLFGGLDSPAKDSHLERCADAVSELYSLRNRIVHYRPVHDRIAKSDESWNVIIRGMLDITAQLYNTKAASYFA